MHSVDKYSIDKNSVCIEENKHTHNTFTDEQINKLKSKYHKADINKWIEQYFLKFF